MHRYAYLGFNFFVLIVIFTTPVTTIAQDGISDPSTLPLLPQDRHIGTMFYGWGAPPPSEIQVRIDDATAVGMNAYTVYLDWTQLEPNAGEYDFVELQETLTWASENGLSTFANITVIDIEQLVIPLEFLTDDGMAFISGYDFANVELVARFLFMLDEIVPILVENGVFYLGVGNEVDGWLNENPDYFGSYLGFIEIVREHVHAINPELAVGITVTGQVPLYNSDWFDAFYLVSDVVSTNIYGIDVSDFTVTDREATITLFERFIAAFDDRPIVIPELGCTSAESMESSLELQRECFETLFGVLEQHSNVRFATVFTFHDFEEEVCEAIQQVFGYDNEVGFETIYDERIADYLCTLGIVNADGSPKPAFATFLEGVNTLTTQ